MTTPIVQRLRNAAAAIRDERVSMRAMSQAHGPDAHGTLMLLLAMPCLLPVAGVGTVLGLGMAALAVTMWRVAANRACRHGWPISNYRATVCSGCLKAWPLRIPWRGAAPERG